MTIQDSLGVINHIQTNRRTDYLYRISIKGLIKNDNDEILVVKEAGRDWWDLPGGGMDHGEDLKTAIAREMKEEVNLIGDFLYRVIFVDEPEYLKSQNFWQIRIIFELQPINMTFSPGEDGDEVKFINPDKFKNSLSEIERKIYKYSNV